MTNNYANNQNQNPVQGKIVFGTNTITNGPEIHMSQAPAQPQAQVQQPNFSAVQQPQAQIQPVMQQPVQQTQPSFGGFGTVNQVQQPVQSSSYTNEELEQMQKNSSAMAEEAGFSYPQTQPVQQPVQQAQPNFGTAQQQMQPQYQSMAQAQQPQQNFGSYQQPQSQAYNYNGYAQPQEAAQNGVGYDENRHELKAFPVKLFPKITQKGRALEFLMKGINLTNYDPQGNRVSCEFKWNMNFWTFDQNNRQMDYIPCYGDMSHLAALAMAIQNGSIFGLTEDYRQRLATAQADPNNRSNYTAPIWENLGGTTKEGTFKLNGNPLQNVGVIYTNVSLLPSNEPNCWVLQGTFGPGEYQRNGAIFRKKGSTPFKTITIKLNYFDLCAFAANVLALFNANVVSLVSMRVNKKEGV